MVIGHRQYKNFRKALFLILCLNLISAKEGDSNFSEGLCIKIKYSNNLKMLKLSSVIKESIP